MDKSMFIGIIRPVFELYSKEATKGMINLYFDVLGNYDPELLNACLKECCKTCKFMPKPADIEAIKNTIGFLNIFELIDNEEEERLRQTINLQLGRG